MDDHYQLLGLDVSASREAIERAVEELAEKADILAYTAPRRSNELWSRLRQVREDLLSDPERRAAYDRAVLAPPRFPVAPPMAARASAAQPTPAFGASRGYTHGRAAPIVPLTVAGVVAAALVLASASELSDRPPPRARPVAMIPSLLGQHHAGRYLSGEQATLQWNPVPRASRYRLLIMTRSSRNRLTPFRTVTTTNTSYDLPLLGEQRYVWQVQPYIDGYWGQASRPQGIEVARPSIGVPIPVSPSTHSSLVATEVEFCWSHVDGAAGYRFWIRGVGGMNVLDTCEWMSVHPGTYRWTVAALVRGAHLYTGRYVAPQYFTVLPQVAAIYPKKPRIAKPSSPGHHAIAHRSTRSKPRSTAPASPVVVAALAPAQSAERNIGATRVVSFARVPRAASAAGAASRLGAGVRRAVLSSPPSRAFRGTLTRAMSARRVGTSSVRGGATGVRTAPVALSAVVGPSAPTLGVPTSRHTAHRQPPAPVTVQQPVQVALAAPTPTVSVALPSSASLNTATRSASPVYSSGAGTTTTYSAGPGPGAAPYRPPAVQLPAGPSSARQLPVSAPVTEVAPSSVSPPPPAASPPVTAATPQAGSPTDQSNHPVHPAHPAHGKKH